MSQINNRSSVGFWGTREGMVIRWIVFFPASYLLFSVAYFITVMPLGFFLVWKLNWYIKFVLFFSVLLPYFFMSAASMMAISLLIMPRIIICGILVGGLYTVSNCYELLGVWSGRVDVGDIPTYIYCSLQVILLLIYWGVFAAFAINRNHN